MSKGNFIAQLSKKERRTLKHIMNTCFKYDIGFQFFGHGVFVVQHFIDGSFTFNEEVGSYMFKKNKQPINELREKLDVYIKYNILSGL